MIPICKIHGRTGKKSVDIIELTALKKKNDFVSFATRKFAHLIDSLAALFDQCDSDDDALAQNQNDEQDHDGENGDGDQNVEPSRLLGQIGVDERLQVW
jgi:hypothetical protein